MRLLVVDDEPLARQRLQRQLADIPGVEVLAEADSGQRALDMARDLQPEVVLMDIRMPGMDGLEAARQLAALEPAPAVIFCTAYDDYAVQAFDAAAIAYLMKPVDRNQLERALQRASRLNRAQLQALQPPVPAPGRRQFLSETAHGVEVLSVDEVRYFRAEQKYVVAVHPGGEMLLNESLRQLEEEFGECFFRVHRNALVALAFVQGLERTGLGQYRVRLAGVDEGPLVSRRHVAAVKKRLTVR